ncbi:MAG: EVE domain-containing protein [Gammaproteobacteria bacterium]|nr:EVE domain-containing protein [Gammaproteobacteria bacterium]
MNYWLVKSEPDDFSLNDLKAKGSKGEGWNGVRNYQARNFMRDDMRVGDLVLFYHSSCKSVGVVGIARVVRAAYPDPTQFDPHSAYYDAKATNNTPRWYQVDIAFESKFNSLVSLQTIKSHPELSEIALITRSRLSVMPIEPAHFHIIKALGSMS